MLSDRWADSATRTVLRRLSVIALVAGAASLCGPAATGHAHDAVQPGPLHAISHASALALAPAWEITYAIARWVTYSTVLLAAGGALFLVAVHDRRPSELRLVTGIVIGGALIAVVGTVAGIPLHAAEITGQGASAFVDAPTLLAVLQMAVGTSSLVRLAGLAVLLAAVPAALKGRGQVAVLAGGGAAVLSFVLAGHQVTAEPRWLAVAADVCHTLAASIWFGGLVLLGAVLRRRRGADDPVQGAAMVARFSGWATVALAAVAAGGLTLAWVEIRTFAAFTSTRYGWTLAAKIALVGLVAAVGAYNNRLLVPAIARAHRSSATMGQARAWRQLSRTVRGEAAGLTAVLALTAALVHTAPPRPFADEATGHLSIVEAGGVAAGGGERP